MEPIYFKDFNYLYKMHFKGYKIIYDNFADIVDKTNIKNIVYLIRNKKYFPVFSLNEQNFFSKYGINKNYIGEL